VDVEEEEEEEEEEVRSMPPLSPDSFRQR